MDFFDNEYYGFTRNLMASIGLWPYQKPEHRVVRMLCISFIFIHAILFQLIIFITHEYSMSLLIEVSSFSFICLIYLLKYIVVYFNSYHVKQFFEQIRRDWNLVKNIDELNIIRKYAYKAKFYTTLTSLIVYSGTFAFSLTLFIPDILDIVAPLDKPRLRKLPIRIEIFLDEEKYFYVFLFLFATYAFLGMMVIVATETMYMIFVQHICGLFEIISYRLIDAFDTSSSRTISFQKCDFCIKLSSVFSIHQYCLKFLEYFQQKFAASYFVLCGFGLASFSVNMFRFLLAVTENNMYDIILTGLLVYAHFCYSFWMNYFGQVIIDYSEWFVLQIWNTQWYTAPLHIQKLLLFTLLRSTKNCRFIVGNIYVASLEGFATLTSMSLSYCMVIYSVYT